MYSTPFEEGKWLGRYDMHPGQTQTLQKNKKYNIGTKHKYVKLKSNNSKNIRQQN